MTKYAKDFTTRHVKTWEKWLKEWVGKPNLRMLEIGAALGGSSQWFLRNVLTGQGCQYDVVDHWKYQEEIHKQFRKNVPEANVFLGRSQDVLPRLCSDGFRYDVIYVDGCHQSEVVILDLVLSWQMLKSGGILIADDYGYSRRGNNAPPRVAIEGFLPCVRDSMNGYQISKTGQVAIWKKRTGAKQNRGWSPVFGVGINRTGTTSLAAALDRLGFPCMHSPGWLNDHIHYLCKDDPLRDLRDRYQAFVEHPLPYYFRQLNRWYPNARFILTVRDEDDWLESRKRRFEPDGLSRDMPKYYSLRKHARRWFRDHNKAVKEYFAHKSDRLLVIDICGGDGWEPLCGFLGVPVPDESFPCENATESSD